MAIDQANENTITCLGSFAAPSGGPCSAPELAYEKMGNVVVSSVGMMDQVSGWFIQTSVHPLSIAVGSVIRKPWVVDDGIEIREILNLTVLMDHDVVDGAPMIRLATDLVARLEGRQPPSQRQRITRT